MVLAMLAEIVAGMVRERAFGGELLRALLSLTLDALALDLDRRVDAFGQHRVPLPSLRRACASVVTG